ncbi:hypothetical protein K492DRAFT_237994 [Lichtheimia hyalospora FSU 10163]|nr:hypothetical protein K492DRAFT_237994 [Lichtheimia hyalospora FSU 10163]
MPPAKKKTTTNATEKKAAPAKTTGKRAANADNTDVNSNSTKIAKKQKVTQKPAANEKPATKKQQPAKEEKKPVAKKQQPVKEEKKPATKKQQPAKEEKKPAAKKQPAKEEKKPVSTKNTTVQKGKGASVEKKAADSKKAGSKQLKKAVEKTIEESDSDEEQEDEDQEDQEELTEEQEDALRKEILGDLGSSSEDEGGDSSDDENEDVIALDDKALKKSKEETKATFDKNAKKIADKEKDVTSGVIYLGRIPHGFYESQMQGYFEQFGVVKRLRLARSRKTGASKHYAFIEFESEDVAKIVADTMHNYLMFGKLLQCKYIPPESVHRNLFMHGKRSYNRQSAIRKKVKKVKEFNAKRTPAAYKKRVERLVAREDQRRKEIEKAGIKYSFPGYAAEWQKKQKKKTSSK